MVGQRFGCLLVTGPVVFKKGGTYWTCKCDCGKLCVSHGTGLRKGRAKSCGCLRVVTMSKNMKTHGMSGLKIHRVWRAIIQRCTNPNDSNYHRYGGRGITVCPEWWYDFAQFFKDMGPQPSPKHTVDRIDSNGNYCKDNCRWATQEEQQNNRRDNVLITYGGETKTTSQWAKQFNIERRIVADRFKAGQDLEMVFSTKSLKTGKRVKKF